MDIPLVHHLLSYPTNKNGRYRISGVVKGTFDETVENGLHTVGFRSIFYTKQGEPLSPDWPAAQFPPLAAGERLFHAEGTWDRDGTAPSEIRFRDGGIAKLTFMWEHTSDFKPVAVITSEIDEPRGPSRTGLKIFGSIILLGASALLVMKALESPRPIQPRRTQRV